MSPAWTGETDIHSCQRQTMTLEPSRSEAATSARDGWSPEDAIVADAFPSTLEEGYA
jgi:hypothetical protein